MADYEASLKWKGNKEIANHLRKAIEVDDAEFMTIDIEELTDGDVLLTIFANAESIGSLRSTIDDLLVCLLASESALMIEGSNDN